MEDFLKILNNYMISTVICIQTLPGKRFMQTATRALKTIKPVYNFFNLNLATIYIASHFYPVNSWRHELDTVV